MNLNKVIIWGHELHDHTHSYIHNAFYIAFKYMGYETYWYNKNGQNNYPENGILENFDNSLFIVHGFESENLPFNNSSFYMTHNVDWIGDDFKIPDNHNLINNSKGISKDNICNFQVLTKNSKSEISYQNIPYHKYSHDKSTLFFPWGTDLLPYEINKNISNLRNLKVKKISNFVGMMLRHWVIFKNECNKYGIHFRHYGGTFDKNSNTNLSIRDNIMAIQESILAPALQTEWQIENEYIPCRIFKNISYGKMGITNNKSVNELFHNNLIYSSNIEELVKKGLEFEYRKDKFEIIRNLMIYVGNNHTYINRISFIIDFLKEFKNINVITKN